MKRLYFGIDVGAADFWINEEDWAAVQGAVDTKSLKGQRCYLSLDLSKKNDLTALTGTWVSPNAHLSSKTWYWTTSHGLADRAEEDNTPYVEWVEDKYLVAVPGPTIDYTFVAMQAKQIDADHDVAFLAFDAAFMTEFEEACAEIGFPVWRYEGPGKSEGKGLKLVAHAQGPKVMFQDKQLCMPTSITKTEDAILGKRITIDDSPVPGELDLAAVYAHGVGCQGNVTQYRTGSGILYSEFQTYPGAGSLIATDANTPQFAPASVWTDYKGTTGNAGTPVAGAGGGTYTTVVSSPLRGIVASALLSHTLDGVARTTTADVCGAFS